MPAVKTPLPTKCALCGKDPADSQATTFADEDLTLLRLCHDGTDRSCYMRWVEKGERDGDHLRAHRGHPYPWVVNNGCCARREPR